MIAARILPLPAALTALLGGCGAPTVDGLALDQTAWRAVRIVTCRSPMAATTIGLRDGRLVIIGGTGELIFDRIGPSESLR